MWGIGLLRWFLSVLTLVSPMFSDVPAIDTPIPVLLSHSCPVCRTGRRIGRQSPLRRFDDGVQWRHQQHRLTSSRYQSDRMGFSPCCQPLEFSFNLVVRESVFIQGAVRCEDCPQSQRHCYTVLSTVLLCLSLTRWLLNQPQLPVRISSRNFLVVYWDSMS